MRKYRAEPRRPFKRSIDLSLNADPHPIRSRATTRDLSRSGVGVVVAHAVKVGSLLHLAIGDEMRPAVVRRCSRIANGYILGLQFDESFFTEKALRTASTRHWLEIVG